MKLSKPPTPPEQRFFSICLVPEGETQHYPAVGEELLPVPKITVAL